MQSIITYDDKVALYENPLIDDINKVNASDMNEIKSIVNGSLQGTNAMGSIVVDDISGKNLLNIHLNNIFPNASGVVVEAAGYYDAIIDVTNIDNVYVSGDFSLLADVLLRVGKYNSYPIISSTGTRLSPNASGVIDTSDCNYLLLAFYPATGSTIDQIRNSFMANVGTTADTYTPNINIIKEKNGYVKENTTFYANDFKCRNLFNKNIWIKGYIDNTGSIVSANDNATFNSIEIQPSTNYTISLSTTVQGYRYVFYSNSGSFISRSDLYTTGTTFTAPSNAKYVRIFINVDGSAITQAKIDNLNCQVEIGSTATTYTPYKAFENEEVYSTNEVKIGTWIDGKPLYRKVISKNQNIQNDTEFSSGILNIDNCIKIEGTYNSSDDTAITPHPSYAGATNYLRFSLVNKTNGTLKVQSGFSSTNNRNIIITLEYTKTTD